MELSSIADGGKAELLRSSGDAARLLLTEWRDCVAGIPAAAGTAAGAAAGTIGAVAGTTDPGARHCV